MASFSMEIDRLDTIALARGLVERMQMKNTNQRLPAHERTSAAFSPEQCALKSPSEGTAVEHIIHKTTPISETGDQQESRHTSEDYAKHILILEQCLEIHALLLERTTKLPFAEPNDQIIEMNQYLAMGKKPIHYLLNNTPGAIDDTTMADHERMRELCVDVLELVAKMVFCAEAEGSAKESPNDCQVKKKRRNHRGQRTKRSERRNGGVAIDCSRSN